MPDLDQSSHFMSDATQLIQGYIEDARQEALRNRPRTSGILSRLEIELRKGDYMVQEISIPAETSVSLFSRDKVRILYIGKRNRPLFRLQEHCELTLMEKIEIYYNTNNIQEVMKLMFRAPPSSRVQISKDVKFSMFSFKGEMRS